MVRRHFGDLGHGCQADVSTIVRVDVFEHPWETFRGDLGPLSVSQLMRNTVPRKGWSNVPVLVSYSDLIGLKNRSMVKRGYAVPIDLPYGEVKQWLILGFFLSTP